MDGKDNWIPNLARTRHKLAIQTGMSKSRGMPNMMDKLDDMTKLSLIPTSLNNTVAEK